MARQEHYMAHRLHLEARMTVLNVGCGAKDIAKFADCKVVGLNIHGYQVEKAKEFARNQKIGDDFFEIIQGNFLKIPFPGNSFEAVYAIEATVHPPSLIAVYSEILCVLKPRGRFGVYEWVTMDLIFNRDNMHHIALRNRIERGNGIPRLRQSGEAQEAMRIARFNLKVAEDLCAHKVPQP